MQPAVKQHCLKIIDELMKNSIAEMFISPIDPELDDCPDYFDVVRNPMDLTTVRENLEADKYDTVQQWKSDMELIWSNAILYNGEDELINIIAKQLSFLFNEYTKGFTDKPTEDWFSQLNQICEDFAVAVKAVSITNPYLTKKSPSMMSMTPVQDSDADCYQLTFEEINQLANDIKRLKSARYIQQMFECLKSMEPQIVGDKTSLTVNICDLSTSTLLALRDEMEIIKKKVRNED